MKYGTPLIDEIKRDFSHSGKISFVIISNNLLLDVSNELFLEKIGLKQILNSYQKQVTLAEK